MANGHKLKVMSGDAHPELAKDIASILEIELLDATVSQFPDEESLVSLREKVRGADVFVIQPTGPPANHNYMASFLIGRVLKQAGSADRRTLVMPYMGYARADRTKPRERVPIAARLVLDLAAEAGFDRIVVTDPHTDQVEGMSGLPFDKVYAEGTLAKAVAQDIGNLVIVAPDVGAGVKAQGWARRGGSPHDWAMVIKGRDDPETTHVNGIIGDVTITDRDVLVVDDVISTGGTIEQAVQEAAKMHARSIRVAATHGLFTKGALARLTANPNIERIYVTDTIPQRRESPKLQVVSIAPLLANAIREIHDDGSVTNLS